MDRNYRLIYCYALIKYIEILLLQYAITKGGENMDKDQIKSLVAGLGIASLVAGVSIAAPAQAAQSG